MSRRKNASRVAALLRNYHQDSDSNSDNESGGMTSAFVTLLQAAISQSTRKSANPKRKRNTTKKPATKKKPTTPKNKTKQNGRKVPSAVNFDSDSDDNEIATADISDTINETYTKKVESKVDTFFKSGSLMSDDDDDEVLNKQSNIISKPKPKDFYVLSDSDEDLPSTSTVKDVVKSVVQTIDPPKEKDEDLMEIVDKILDSEDTPIEIETKTEEPDSWSVFKSKTEEIMGSVTAFLDTFKKDEKEKPQPETPPEKTKLSCPICLEVLVEDIVPGATVCGHIFCMDCIQKVAKTSKTCPTCRKRITVKQIHPLYI